MRTTVAPVQCIERAIRISSRQYWHLFGVCAVGILIAMFAPMQILIGPMLCGIYASILREMRGEEPKFDVLFKGFDHFVATLAPWGLRLGIALLAVIPMYVLMFGAFLTLAQSSQGGGQPGGPAIAAMLGLYAIGLLLVIVASLATVLLQFSELLIIEHGLDGWSASKLSARAVQANLWGMLGLVLLHALLTTLGMLLCCVGFLFVLPAAYTSTVLAYQKIFPGDAQALAPGEVPPPIRAIG